MERFRHQSNILTQRPEQTISEDFTLMAKALHVLPTIWTRNDGNINLIRYILTYFILIDYLVET